MTPEDLVRALCARHGLPPEAGAPYLILVQKALTAPDEVRDRILTLVNEGLSQRAQGLTAVPPAGQEVDREILVAIAKVLHTWAPSDSMLDLGSTLGHFGQGPEAA
jgi:hypothetical protein